jgi:hypothetical protein
VLFRLSLYFYVGTETTSLKGSAGARARSLRESGEKFRPLSQVWRKYCGASRLSQMWFLQKSRVCQYPEKVGASQAVKNREEGEKVGCSYLSYGKSAPSAVRGNAVPL